jgi:putative oxidoreductase
MILRTVEWVFRVALASLFLYAGVGKIRDLQQFAIDIHNYNLTPWSLSVAVAVYLPWLEIVSAIGLIAAPLYSAALVTIGALSVTFVAVLGSAWARGLDISCGCLGKSGTTSVAEALIRAVAILGVVGFLGWRRRRVPAF